MPKKKLPRAHGHSRQFHRSMPGRIVADGPPRDVLTKALLAETFGVNAQIVTLADAPVAIPWTVTG